MKKYDGWLIVSDMDATLLDENKQISAENKQAIDYFIENGGLFTVASGRMATEVKMYFDTFSVNAPAILNNGAQIHDFKNDIDLMLKCIEEDRKDSVRRAYENISGVGIEVCTASDNVYIYRECSETGRYKKRNVTVNYGMNEQAWSDKWIKVLIIGEKEQLDAVDPVYRSMYDKGYVVRSGENYLDIVANGASKGNALTVLFERMGVKRDHVIAVGDNMNDISMIYPAGIGVAVENGVDELKNAADIIAPPHTEPVVKFVIEEIIDKRI